MAACSIQKRRCGSYMDGRYRLGQSRTVLRDLVPCRVGRRRRMRRRVHVEYKNVEERRRQQIEVEKWKREEKC
jgi:hypothetical protein